MLLPLLVVRKLRLRGSDLQRVTGVLASQATEEQSGSDGGVFGARCPAPSRQATSSRLL